jgi:hypothetical protein
MNTKHCRAVLVNVPTGGYMQYCRDPTKTRESTHERMSDTDRNANIRESSGQR